MTTPNIFEGQQLPRDASPVGVGAGAGASAGAGAGASANDQFREAKDQIVEHTKASLRDARDKAASSLGESRLRLADQLGGVASAFRSTGERLRQEDQERVASLTDSLAGQTERVSRYLKEKDFAGMQRDAEDLARRKPALVAGAVFALGLFAARFIKSSKRGGSGNPVGRRYAGA